MIEYVLNHFIISKTAIFFLCGVNTKCYGVNREFEYNPDRVYPDRQMRVRCEWGIIVI